MTENLKEELDFTKKELTKAKSEMKLIEDKLDYCQNRLLDIRNEKDNLKKELKNFEFVDIDAKLKEVDLLKTDFLKQQHRLEITKDLLEESRKEITLLKKILNDLLNMSNLDFIRNKYPESFNQHFIIYEKYSKYDKHKEEL